MARRHGFTALLPGDFGISDIFAGMLGLAYGSGLNFADNDSQLAVGICGNLVQPLIGDLKGRILEHRHQLFIQLFYDLILSFLGSVRIADHHHCQILVILLDNAVGNDLRNIIDNTGDIAPFRDGVVPVMDHIIHTALDASRKAKTAAHVAVKLIVGSIVDQRKLRLVQAGDHSHALEGGAGQILIVHIYHKQVAVDLIILLSGDADHA